MSRRPKNSSLKDCRMVLRRGEDGSMGASHWIAHVPGEEEKRQAVNT